MEFESFLFRYLLSWYGRVLRKGKSTTRRFCNLPRNWSERVRCRCCYFEWQVSAAKVESIPKETQERSESASANKKESAYYRLMMVPKRIFLQSQLDKKIAQG